MREPRVYRVFGTIVLGMGAIVLCSRATLAQTQGTVRGMVVEMETGRPLPGTQVSIIGGDRQVLTDTAGVFELLDIPGGEIVLRFEHEGRVRTVEKVTVRAGGVTAGVFELPQAIHVLDALDHFERQDERTTGTEVRTDEAENPSGRSIGQILDGVAGVQLVRVGGAVGERYYLRIRGAKSLLFSGPPVVYVDGVRQMERLGSGSVFDLIQPWEVGRVEVLRGPAAAALYGPDTANGVILVTTKRGGG
jgi:TonB-dependent SusC/RagA subfamily outer membrane receptor